MLDDADLADLARTCARRFPRTDDQRLIAEEAGVAAENTDVGDPELAWSSLIRTAQRDGKLGRLAAVLARSAPGDSSLVAVAKALGDVVRPPSKVPAMTFALAGLGLVLLVGAAGAFAMFGGSDVDNVPADAAQSPVVTKATVPPVAVAEPANASGSAALTPVTGTPDAASGAPAAAPPTEAATTPAKPAQNPKSEPLATRPRSSCNGPAGEVVGYWYAGTASPGSLGETITLGRDARVRADYPRQANGHNAATQEVCVLTRGTQMKLLAAPIDASKGHWWVPVVGG